MDISVFNKQTEDFFESLSKEKDYYKIRSILFEHKFNFVYCGINCYVFLNKDINYVIKLSDYHDPIPRKNSRFYKYYAKIIFQSKNKKLRLQKKVDIIDVTKKKTILDNFAKTLNLTRAQLDYFYDIHAGNIGYINKKLYIVDYRNYYSRDFKNYYNKTTWYNKIIK